MIHCIIEGGRGKSLKWHLINYQNLLKIALYLLVKQKVKLTLYLKISLLRALFHDYCTPSIMVVTTMEKCLVHQLLNGSDFKSHGPSKQNSMYTCKMEVCNVWLISLHKICSVCENWASFECYFECLAQIIILDSFA